MLLKNSRLYNSLIEQYFKGVELEECFGSNNSFSLVEIEDSSFTTLFRPRYIYSLEIKSRTGSIHPGEVGVIKSILGNSLNVDYYKISGIKPNRRKEFKSRFKISLDEQLELLHTQN